MALSGSLSLIVEASISAQMILFAGVQAAGIGKAGALRGVLALLSGSLGLAIALNAFAAIGVASGLRDVNLFLELAGAAAIYVYAAHAYSAAPQLTSRSLLHALPAALVFIAWRTGLAIDVDGVVIAILATYAAATLLTVWTHRGDYRPPELRLFVVLLAGSLALLVTLRAPIAYEAQLGVALPQSGAYLALLLAILTLSSAALLIELRSPSLLGAPATYLKYAGNALSDAALDTLNERFLRLMQSEKPFLDSAAGLAEVASALDASERHLSQLANARHGVTFPALLNQCRVEEAARLLRDPGCTSPVTTIMYDAGFGSKSAFQREFQKRFGMSPTAYRTKHRPSTSK